MPSGVHTDTTNCWGDTSSTHLHPHTHTHNDPLTQRAPNSALHSVISPKGALWHNGKSQGGVRWKGEGRRERSRCCAECGPLTASLQDSVELGLIEELRVLGLHRLLHEVTVERTKGTTRCLLNGELKSKRSCGYLIFTGPF